LVTPPPSPAPSPLSLHDALPIFGAHVPVLQRIARALAQLDVLACFASLSSRRDYCRPEFAEDILIEIDAGRHPVVEAQVEPFIRSEEHTSELQSRGHLVCRLLLE